MIYRKVIIKTSTSKVLYVIGYNMSDNIHYFNTEDFTKTIESPAKPCIF